MRASGSVVARAGHGRWPGVARRLSPSSWALLVSVVVAAVWLQWTPLVPDLAAQVARAKLVREAGTVSWWTGWFGGLSLPTYSLLTPSWMAWLGVRATGVLAAVAGAWLTARLLSSALRPRAAAVAFALAEMADLVAGRVTFVVGATLGVAALVAMRAGRSWLLAVLAVAAYFASPLAGLFVGIALAAVVIGDPPRRRPAAAMCVLLLAVGAGTALLFPGTGTMPVSLAGLIPPGLCCLGVVLLCRHRLVRVGALLLLGALVGFLLVPGAVGGNVARLAWVCAAPAVVAYAWLPRRYLAVAVALLAAWPVSDLVQQVASTRDPSTSAGFYQPMLDALRERRAQAGPGAVGERLELVQPDSRWSVAFLGSGQSLARGWDRQADVADDPLFYRAGALTAASYQDWLHQLAVGWVAVPGVALDYASVGEARLVRRGLNYLRPVWWNSSWTLYRVIDAAPLVTGAQLVEIDASSVTVRTAGPADVDLRVRWSPYLTVYRPDGETPPGLCVADNAGWLGIVLPQAGEYRLVSRFDPLARADPDHACR